jgi:ATP-dependent DNA helicase RecG
VDGAVARELLDALRRFGAEATGVEAKKAGGGLPQSLPETLSAFANTVGGGIVLLGIDEANGFAASGVANAAALQADLAAMSAEQVIPALRPVISIVGVEGVTLVVAEVDELPRNQKPCYVRSKGMDRGSYLRVGESDRRLTSEEVQLLIAERGQPLFDHEPVADSSLEDLNRHVLADYLARVRASSPRVFLDEPDDVVLRMTKVTTRSGGHDVLTVAGLLAMGRYPQQFFPQLNATFVHYPTADGRSTSTGVRFLDNVRFDGPIPLMVREALSAIQRNMSRRALITGAGRRDIWDYPPEALREAFVNALVHRDLSPGSRGTQVQVEMYPDRLRVRNPGGLFGSVDITRLGLEGASSARNGLLLKILEDVAVPGEDRTVCENRGSGIRSMRAALLDAGMSPPTFIDKVTSFEVRMPNCSLFDEQTVLWLSALGREGLTDSQCVGLALLRRGEILDNARYRAASGITDSRTATTELQDLVAREWITQTGTRGGAKYTLSDYAAGVDVVNPRPRVRPDRRKQIIDLLVVHGELSRARVSEILNINPKTAGHWLGRLKREGLVESTVAGTGHRDTRYRLASAALDEHPPL